MRPQPWSDLDGDGQDELLARSQIGIQAWDFDAEITGLSASNDGLTNLDDPTELTAETLTDTNFKYQWDFDDGSGITPNYDFGQVTHVFGAPGTYTVTVTTSNSYGSLMAQTTVEVYTRAYWPALVK